MERLNSINAFVFDVDGVLTDGGIYYDTDGNELKKFNVKDGQISSYIQKKGIKLGIITGRESRIVEKRFNELKYDFIRQGVQRKDEALLEFCSVFNLLPENVCYTGDDVNDLPAMKIAGLACCPSNAAEQVKNEVDVVLEARGGEGVARELFDKYLKYNKGE